MVLSPSQIFFNPETFAETFLRVLDKNKNLVPLRYNKAQRHFLANRTPKSIVLKARQLGFSTLLQAELFRLVTTGTATTLTLTHLDSTTQALRRMSDRFYENLPLGFRPARKYANATVTTYSDFGSEAIIATAGSKNSARGITANHAHLSEVAFWQDADVVMTSVLQAIPIDGTITIESTANGIGNYFYDTVMAALDGSSPFKLFFYAWWWDDSYQLPLLPGETLEYTDEEAALASKHRLTPEQIKWRRSKIKELSPIWFSQEYPEDVTSAFLSSGNSVFGDVRGSLYTPPADDKPIDKHYYVGGVDWGQENDYTVLSIIDADESREVCLLRMNKMRWDAMRALMLNACERWNVQKLWVEKNAASSNIENLKDDIDGRSLNIAVSAFSMTNKRKGEMVVALYDSLHDADNPLRLIDDPVGNTELRGFESKQTDSGVWTYSVPESLGHDDTVIARMAANWGARRRIPDEW